METAKIFPNGGSQAVRLPKEYRFDEEEVCVARLGPMVILFPRSRGWEILARGIEGFTDDFLAERDQPAAPDDRKTL